MSKKRNETGDVPDDAPTDQDNAASNRSRDATDPREKIQAESTEPPTAAEDVGAKRQELAEAFGRTTDPLAEFEDTFREVDLDVFAMFFDDVLDQQDPNPDTRYQFEMTFEQWRDHMAVYGRHPACPTEEHVKAFIDQQLTPEENGGEGNKPRTVKEKLRKLNNIYKYWQQEAAFPHPTDYNPVEVARQKRRDALTSSSGKDYQRIPIEELQEMIASVTDIRRRAIIGLQFKLGLRAGELANIRLADINLTSAELARHYPDLGTNPGVTDYENAIYIPPSSERDGNKSKRPRVLPLDDETRQLLLRYLLIRPDAGEPWLVLSKKTHSKIDKKVVNKEWKEQFHPKYAETEEYKSITSHFGRHRFSTFWRVEQDVPRELVQYMRGDKTGKGSMNHRDAIDTYLHTYYEDIENLYRENIYKLGL